MAPLHARTASPTTVSTKRLLRLERTGRYEEALALFGEEWERADFLPEVSHLAEPEAAETLLRFGALIGFHGYQKQLDGAQLRAKDILTDAHARFAALGFAEKVAECENHIALCYWRTGEGADADTWLEMALSHDIPRDSYSRLHTLMLTSLMLLAARRDDENIEWCHSHEQRFREAGDDYLSGGLYANIAVSYRNLKRPADAMRYFCQARSCHEKAGHKTNLAITQNNLALLHNAERRFESAHEAADSAIKLYKQVKDKTREASSLDTKALIYLTERRLPEAIAAIDRSVAMLRKGESWAYLAESLVTKARILVASDDLPAAIVEVSEALTITRTQNTAAAAKALAEEFLAAVREHFEPESKPVSIDTRELELAIPAEIAHYEGYRGLWVNTPYLEKAGVAQGSLAIIAPCEAKRGDLVALKEQATGTVSCGYYDAEFGIICLDRGDDEPLLFDANDVNILGKIVGVSSGVPDENGKTQVLAL